MVGGRERKRETDGYGYQVTRQGGAPPRRSDRDAGLAPKMSIATKSVRLERDQELAEAG